jgi:hypothetical protein
MALSASLPPLAHRDDAAGVQLWSRVGLLGPAPRIPHRPAHIGDGSVGGKRESVRLQVALVVARGASAPQQLAGADEVVERVWDSKSSRRCCAPGAARTNDPLERIRAGGLALARCRHGRVQQQRVAEHDRAAHAMSAFVAQARWPLVLARILGSHFLGRGRLVAGLARSRTAAGRAGYEAVLTRG